MLYIVVKQYAQIVSTLVFSGEYQPDELYEPNLLLIVYIGNENKII